MIEVFEARARSSPSWTPVLDYDSCYFAEPDHAAPPINTGFQDPNVDLSRRKVIAYDFLYSCDQYPGAPGCDDPSSPSAYDNQGHGTHAAGSAAGDIGVSLVHDYADAIAPAAKLIVQDAGYVGGDFCSQFPALGCPAFEQTVTVQSGTRLRVVLVWTDPPGTVSGPFESTPQLVNDLDLVVRDPAGRISYGNERLHPGTADRRNNVEMVQYLAPEGTYQISVRANRLAVGPRQSFALVIVGDFLDTPARRRPARFR